jgi:hypothetical protein
MIWLTEAREVEDYRAVCRNMASAAVMVITK